MKTILIVDDEYAIVETLVDLLQDEGYRVVFAGNGRDGLARLEKENPDLVIVDYMMPIADGRQLVREMRALPAHQSTPVVMMSAAARDAALSDGQGGQLDVSAFLSKPFSLEDLLERVFQLLGKPGQDPSGPTQRTIH
jgi:two-component system response regulator VicR